MHLARQSWKSLIISFLQTKQLKEKSRHFLDITEIKINSSRVVRSEISLISLDHVVSILLYFINIASINSKCYLVTKPCLTLLWSHRLQPAKLLCRWDFSGKNTGVGCHFLLQGIFPMQGSSLGLLNWQADSLSLCPPGKPINAKYLHN